MLNNKVISKLISIATSAVAILLFIYFLPEILILLGTILLLIIIAIFTLKYILKKRLLQMNFVFNNKNKDEEQSEDKIEDMKDVTNS